MRRATSLVPGILFLIAMASCGPEDPTSTDIDGKADTWRAIGGISIADPGDEVWQVLRSWADTAPNGETYENYYATWLSSIRHDAQGQNVEYVMADGSVFPAPSLECADTAQTLRFIFACENNLPMFVTVYTERGREFMGHFGWVRANGTRVTSYSSFSLNAPRQSDSALQRDNRYLRDRDHRQDYPSDGSTTGAYFDAIMTNKRFGRFIQDLLNISYSGDLANDYNTYYIVPEAMRGGDLQLHRSNPTDGIGHTITIQDVVRTSTGQFSTVDIIQSYMPTEPWISAASSELQNYQPDPVNHSGLRRWLVPVRRSGSWQLTYDRDVAAVDRGWDVRQNPQRFTELFDVDPAAELEELLSVIEQQRIAQAASPNSCRRREDRETAFDRVYEIYRTTPALYQELGFTSEPSEADVRLAVDRRHRTINDFIWAEMDYARSWVCHWNPPDPAVNADMYRAAVAFNRERLQRDGCQAIRFFRAENVTRPDGTDGFADLEAWAAQNSFRWAPYSNDENGNLSGVRNDALLEDETELREHFCTLFPDLQYWQQP